MVAVARYKVGFYCIPYFVKKNMELCEQSIYVPGRKQQREHLHMPQCYRSTHTFWLHCVIWAFADRRKV